MKPLIWHWGRRGAGPLFAVRLAQGWAQSQGVTPSLSLAAGAEIFSSANPPDCDWREPTYGGKLGYAAQLLISPFLRGRTLRHLRECAPDIAICAMPALLDQRMVTGLRRLKLPYAVIVHDATAHPGEALHFRFLRQNALLRGAHTLFPLTAHVAADLRAQGFGAGAQRIIKLWHPPISFAPVPAPLAHGGRPRLLCFGRLLPYKGLDLLADALGLLGPAQPDEVRVCGDGPPSAELGRLRALPSVTLEHRWFAEDELPGLIAWADALVLPYREASQSGIAALGLAAGRHILATNVGGLPEQLAGMPRARLCAPDADSIAAGLTTLAQGLRAPPAAPPDLAAQGWPALASAIRAAF